MKENSFLCCALGIGTQNLNQQLLEIFYYQPIFHPSKNFIQSISRIISYKGENQTFIIKPEEQVNLFNLFQIKASVTDQPVILTILEKDLPPQNISEAFLKLHLLSYRFVKPHEINLDGIFSKLLNIAWTSQGAIALEELAERQLQSRLKGETLEVFSVDKFPKMVNYITPEGVRIADTARVRLGAYLGEGTTVMHEGFINFNAGTIGPNMVEGRISAGVIVDAGSDLGGGCSTMGTLSGGNQTIISVGKNCLIGANAGIGISLGNGCIVEAGLYVTAGAKVNIIHNKEIADTVYAYELSGENNLLFRRNSLTGTLECLNTQTSIELNNELHKN